MGVFYPHGYIAFLWIYVLYKLTAFKSGTIIDNDFILKPSIFLEEKRKNKEHLVEKICCND